MAGPTHSERTFPCLHTLFERQAAARPDHPAVVYLDHVLTYRQLNARANQIAHRLIAMGAKRDAIVALYLGRSHEMIAAILGILKSGAAYLPLDPAYPPQRRAFMLEDSDASIVITERAYLDAFPDEQAAPILTIDEDDVSAESAEDPEPYDAERLAYVIYTSGSTGRPNGVLIEHRSAVSYIEATRRAFGIQPDDRTLLFNSISFDPSVEDIFVALASGATLVVRTDDMARSATGFVDGIRAQKISTLSLPTAYWRELINGIDALPSSIRYCVIGGEAAFPQHVARWRELTDAPLWNAYGPTEATIAITMCDVADANTSEAVPIGRPVDGVDIHLLDANLRPVSEGAPGEIYAGGVQLARGYHKRPDLTAKRFVENPFAPGARLYKTGDLGSMRADGLIDFLGRADGQVKLRGYRIELGEIEEALSAIGVEAVVRLLNDPTGEPRLVAYVVAGDDTETLRRSLARSLPYYMLPDRYVHMERLPISPGGKVDRKDLPEPEWSHRAEGRRTTEPQTELETYLADMWGEALGFSPIGTDEDFFDLGGHSLLAIRIFGQIEKDMGLELPPSVLYEAPTIARLAELIEGLKSGARKLTNQTVIPIQPNGSKPPIFCVGGGVVNLSNLARALGPDQPFYALQWRALPDSIMIESSLSKIAAFFVSAVRDLDPNGPYRIAGSFTAGMIAIEMARQLSDAGAQVETLATFDTPVSADELRKIPAPVNGGGTQRSVLQKALGVLQRGPSEIWDHLTNPYYREILQIRFYKLVLAVYMRTGWRLPSWMRSGMGEELFIQRATRGHVPRAPFSGELELFLTPALYNKFGKLQGFGWSAWIGGAIHDHQVPGEPCDIMLSPNVEQLAAEFSRSLERTAHD